jgi:hypothetical protein
MKTRKEIKEFRNELKEADDKGQLINRFGSKGIKGKEKGMFDITFMTGFRRGLRYVDEQQLGEGEIRRHHKHLLLIGKDNRDLIGERNAYAWCLDWKR